MSKICLKYVMASVPSREVFRHGKCSDIQPKIKLYKYIIIINDSLQKSTTRNQKNALVPWCLNFEFLILNLVIFFPDTFFPPTPRPPDRPFFLLSGPGTLAERRAVSRWCECTKNRPRRTKLKPISGLLKVFFFFGQGQIKMMTRIDLTLNAQRREWRRWKADDIESTPLSPLGGKYKVDSRHHFELTLSEKNKTLQYLLYKKCYFWSTSWTIFDWPRIHFL